MSREVKQTILVMTYRQEEYIGQCLDSILTQSTLPHKVIVFDDCSPDNTWGVVERYIAQFPDIVVGVRNQQNKGVFGNYNQMLRYAEGDMVHIVAGDDMLPTGALEAYTNFIVAHNLDCSEPFIIYTNADVLLNDGGIKSYNNYKLRSIDPVELALMCEFYHWDTGMSIGLVQKMPEICEGIGYQADWLQHIQRALCCKSYYFLDHTGYVYRQGVGVTVSEKDEIQRNSLLGIIDIYRKEYPQIITPKINRFFKLTECYFAYLKHPNAKRYFMFLLARIRMGRVGETNSFYHNWKVLIPRSFVNLAKKILKKQH